MKLSPLQVTVLTIALLILVILNIVKIIVKPICSFLLGPRIPLVVRTPEDCFQGLDKVGYTFAPNYLR